MTGLHDAGAGAGDDHEPGFDDLFSEFNRLLVSLFVGRGTGRAEDGHFASLGIRGKQAVGVAEFPDRGLNDPHIAGPLYVREDFQSILDDVGHGFLVVAAAFESDEFQHAAV